MDSLSSMNKALAYIEDHLVEDIDYGFSFLSGIGLSEYIRRRRLTLAALDLKDTNLKIIDVAVKYGYDSADSFSRAFYAVHGVLPSDARSENTQLKAYPRMTFQLSIKGGCEMNYRIVEKGPFKIVGIKKRVPIIFAGVNPEIAKMTELLTPEVIRELKALSNVEPTGIISASANFSEGRMEEKGELDHYIGVATSSEGAYTGISEGTRARANSRTSSSTNSEASSESSAKTAGFDVLEVEASTWAVFESVGPFPKTLQNVWSRIYSEWFPSSGYELAPGPEILWNESPNTSNPEYRSEIWMPVKPSAIYR